MYKFSIIIATYNGENYLKDCLSSVFETIYSSFETIIVDDGSTDKSFEIFKNFKKKYKFTVIKNEKNLGLVASRNKAINQADGDILVFLDNDTKVDRNWLRELNKTFSTDQTIGATQCKIFDFKKREIIQEVGMKLNPYTGFGTVLGRGEKDRGQFEERIEVISLGAALAVRKALAKKIEGFDQKLFHYTDDLDFSWRIWISGARVVLTPNAKIFHYTKIHKPNYKLYYHLSKNSIRMVIKNYELINIIKFLSLTILLNIIGGVYVFLTRLSMYAIVGVLMGCIWNIIFIWDTLHVRYKVQILRRKTDREIFNKIMISSNLLNIANMYFKGSKTTVSLMKAQN